MNHYAAGKSDALVKLGPNYQPFLIDNKLRVFILVDNVIDDPVSQATAARMLNALHRVLHNNHKILDTYAKDPSYANRVRASLILELSLNQARRKSAVAQNEESDTLEDSQASGMLSSILPSFTIIALGFHSALIVFGAASGVYQVRNNLVRFLNTPDLQAHSSRLAGIPGTSKLGQNSATSLSSTGSKSGSKGASSQTGNIRVSSNGGNGIKGDSQIRAMSGNTSGLVHTSDESKAGILDIDVQPGDFFLMATDGLISVLGKGKQLHEFCKEGNAGDILGRLVENATPTVKSHVVTGLIVKSLGITKSRDPQITAKLEPLRKINLLRRLNDSELLKVLAMMKVYSFVPGQQMVSTGDDDQTVYICLSGKFDLILGGKKVGELMPSSDATQYGFINSWPQAVKLQAAIPSKMLVVPPESIRWLRDNEPIIANKLLWEIADVMASRTRRSILALGAQPNNGPISKFDISSTGHSSSVPHDKTDPIFLLPDDSGAPYIYRPPRRPTVEHDMDELGDL